MTELAGIDGDRVGTFSWMLSSLFAGLAGVLLAPLFPQVSSESFFLLVVAAIAVAVFASLSSLPMALLGGVLLGVLGQVLATELPTGSVLSQGLRPSLPFVALFLLLVLRPGLRRRREVTDPLAGVDPPSRGFTVEAYSRSLTLAARLVAAALLVAGVAWVLLGADSFWLALCTQAVVFSVIFCSVTVITGMARQISLCLAAFAAIGAFTTAQLSNQLGVAVLLAMLAGAVVAAAVGALLALPALRLGGIFLALATLAFAMFFENVIVHLSWFSGGVLPPTVYRPVIGSIDFNSDKSFFVLALLVLAVVATTVVLVRGGTTGRYLDALGTSEVAASAIGIDPALARVTAFALSAGIAGLGGGLLAMQERFANYQSDFTVFVGLFWVVLVVSIGARTVEGAIVAGLFLKVFPELVLKDWLHVSSAWQFALFGLAAISYARDPEGILEGAKRVVLDAIQRPLDRWRGSERDRTAGTEPAAVGRGSVTAAPRGDGGVAP